VVLDDPAQVIPSFAYPGTIQVDDRTLRMEMEHCAELAPLSRKKRPELKQGDFTGFFTCELQGTTGHLKTPQVGRSIDENDLETCQFRAYAHNRGDSECDDVVVATSEPTHARSLKIAPDGIVTASPDLSGKCLKVIVTYPQAVVTSDTPISTICPHLVGKWQDGSVVCATFPGSELLDLSDRKLIATLAEPDIKLLITKDEVNATRSL
jgi:hypothetical protein